MRWRSVLSLAAVAVALTGFAAPGSAASPYGPKKVIFSNKHDVSPPLSSMVPLQVTGQPREMPRPVESRHAQVLPGGVDKAVQQRFATTYPMPAPSLSIEGQPNTFGGAPPDTQGDVGLNHYVQWDNLSFAVWDKLGNKVYPQYGYAAGNTLWQGFGGVCESHNDGDPITVYDEMAGRWVMSQFAITLDALGSPAYPAFECVAVSQTSDPTGAWYRYEFGPFDYMNDYPKMGVWPDGYYMTANLFDFTSGFGVGVGVWILDRTAMLAGNSALSVYFQLISSDPADPAYWSWAMLPSDLEGTPPSAVGSPDIMTSLIPASWGYPTGDTLAFWHCQADWTDPAASTMTWVQDLPIAGINSSLCGGSRNCIPQPGTTRTIDPIASRLMHRLQYRNFPGVRETLVTNMTVNVATSGDQAGIRWFELENTGAAWTVKNQASTPADGVNRWMGSAAMDASGNLALGYSVANASTFPGIRYAGRLATDPANELQAEVPLIDGAGAQTGTNRWGDYSAMQVDPVDECTFWYTQEYYQTTSAAGFQTRIGAFKFPECVTPAKGTLAGTVTDDATLMPIAHAVIQAGSYNTMTGPDGTYTIDVTPGTYQVTATAFGYASASVTGIQVTDGATTTQDFALTENAKVDVDGFVRAGIGPLWPLYAKVSVYAQNGPVQVLYTDPGNGYYNVSLYEGQTYFFVVESVLPGYEPQSRSVVPANPPASEDFLLVPLNCTAQGFQWVYGLAQVDEHFDAATLPADWSVVDDAGNGVVWRFDNPGARPNFTGGTGNFAIVDSDIGGPLAVDTELRTKVMDFTGIGAVTLEFKSAFYYFGSPTLEAADVDVSNDGGATWFNVWSRTGANDVGTYGIDISDIAGNQANVMVRFHYYDAYYSLYWEIDDVFVGERTCEWTGGGLVYGTVKDANTKLGIANATVTADTLPPTVTLTGNSPSMGGGFFEMFVPGAVFGPNTRIWTASKERYASQQYVGAINPGGTLRIDFELPAGMLSYNPGTALTQRVDPLGSASQTFGLVNSGGVAANFLFSEFIHPAPAAPHLKYALTKKLVTDDRKTAARAPAVQPRQRPARGVAPEVFDPNGAAIPTGGRYRFAGTSCDGTNYYIFGGWVSAGATNEAFRYDPAPTDAWQALAPMPYALANVTAACVGTTIYVVGGMDTDYFEYNTLQIYDTVTDTWAVSTMPFTASGLAATAYNDKLYVFGGVFRQAYSYDPVTDNWVRLADSPYAASYGGAVTMTSSISQRSDTLYFIGGWPNATYVQRYNPSQDLWDPTGPQLLSGRQSPLVARYGNLIYVLGGGSGWAPVGTIETFDPSQWPGGAWAVNPDPLPNASLGMAGGCAANKIWAAGGYNGTSIVADNRDKNDSLLCTGYAAGNIPWFGVDPAAGFVADHGEFTPLTGTFDATLFSGGDLASGLHRAQLKLTSDTPYASPMLPLNFIVRYFDVADTNIFQSFIYGIAGAGITAGCGYHAYCPDAFVPRNQMAAFLAVAMLGETPVPWSGTVGGQPYDCQNGPSLFNDVPYTDPFCRSIHYIYQRGVTAGCGGGNFCPSAYLPREQMAVFLAVVMLNGSPIPHSGMAGTQPYSCDAGPSLFNDVAVGNPYCPAIHYIYAQGVTGGCGGGAYCPASNTTRGQMAVFLTVVFDIFRI